MLVCAPKGDPIYAIKTGGTGELGDDAVAWVSREVRELSSDVPTPAFYDDDFFVLSSKRKSTPWGFCANSSTPNSPSRVAGQTRRVSPSGWPAAEYAAATCTAKPTSSASSPPALARIGKALSGESGGATFAGGGVVSGFI